MKPQIVLDTNVWVAAFRSTRGASRRVIDELFAGAYELHVSVPLVFEYEEVFLRNHPQMHLSKAEAAELVTLICRIAIFHEIYYLWRWQVKDPEDAHVLEVAVAAPCDYLVTFNVRDLEEAQAFGIRVITPGDFLKAIRQA